MKRTLLTLATLLFSTALFVSISSCSKDSGTNAAKTPLEILSTPTWWELVLAKNVLTNTDGTTQFKGIWFSKMKVRTDGNIFFANENGSASMGSVPYKSISSSQILMTSGDTLKVVSMTDSTFAFQMVLDRDRPDSTLTELHFSAIK